MKKRLRKSFPPKYTPLNPDRAYEYYKQQWISLHPDATPAEYEAAIRKITKLVRV